MNEKELSSLTVASPPDTLSTLGKSWRIAEPVQETETKLAKIKEEEEKEKKELEKKFLSVQYIPIFPFHCGQCLYIEDVSLHSPE